MSRFTLLSLLAIAFIVGLVVGSLVIGGNQRSHANDMALQLERQNADLVAARQMRDEAMQSLTELQNQQSVQAAEQADVDPVEASALLSAGCDINDPSVDGQVGENQADENQVGENNANGGDPESPMMCENGQAQEVTALQAELAAVKAEIDQVQASATAEKQTLTQRAETAETALSALQEESGSMLAAAKEQAAEALTALQGEKDQLVQGLTDQLNDSQGMIETLKANLDAAILENATLADGLSKAQAAIEGLRNAPPVQILIDGVADALENN